MENVIKSYETIQTITPDFQSQKALVIQGSKLNLNDSYQRKEEFSPFKSIEFEKIPHFNRDLEIGQPKPLSKKELMKQFEKKLKQQAKEKKERLRKEAQARRPPPLPPYNYQVPDPGGIPFPTIKICNETREIRPVEEILQEKRNKALVFDEQFTSFQKNIALDGKIEDMFEEMNKPLLDISDKNAKIALGEYEEEINLEELLSQPIEKQIDKKLLLKNRAIQEGNILLYEDAEILDEKEIEKSIKYYQNKEYHFSEEEEELSVKSGFWEEMPIDKNKQNLEGRFQEDFSKKEVSFEKMAQKEMPQKKPEIKKEVQEEEELDIEHLSPEVQYQREILKLKNESDKKINGLKLAMEINRREWNALMREKTTIFIQESVADTMKLFQKEVIKLMEQLSVLREVIRKKDMLLKECCIKFKNQEQKISEYATRYNAKDIRIDIYEKQLERMRRPPDPMVFMPIEDRLVKYLNAVEDDQWTDPLELSDVPNLLMKPFYFYGGFVALNAQDRSEVAEKQTIIYYKCIIKDLSDSVSQTKTELEFLLQQNEKQQNEITDLKRELFVTKRDRDRQFDKYQRQIGRYDGIIEKMHLKFHADLSAEIETRTKEKEMIDRELELNKKITESTQEINQKLTEEIKQLKLMLKVPRLHFKNIEKSDWDMLSKQYEEIISKQNKFGQKQVGQREQMRINQIMKSNFEPNKTFSTNMHTNKKEPQIQMELGKQENHTSYLKVRKQKRSISVLQQNEERENSLTMKSTLGQLPTVEKSKSKSSQIKVRIEASRRQHTRGLSMLSGYSELN